MCTHNLCFVQKYESGPKIQLKIIIFTAVKYCYILHGRVCVMGYEMAQSGVYGRYLKD